MIGTCEAMNLAIKLGLDPQNFFDIASKASGQNWSLTSYCPVPGPVPRAVEPRLQARLRRADDAQGSQAGHGHARPGRRTPRWGRKLKTFMTLCRQGRGGHGLLRRDQMARWRDGRSLDSHLSLRSVFKD
jgi:3-hydroxyisobutyrate dehydrogenase